VNWDAPDRRAPARMSLRPVPGNVAGEKRTLGRRRLKRPDAATELVSLERPSPSCGHNGGDCPAQPAAQSSSLNCLETRYPA
jgi:hypothetical protein